MKVVENISLRQYNTFGINAHARHFSAFSNVAELEQLLQENAQIHRLVLGGGSNILFTKDYKGLILKNEVRGIEELHEDPDYVYIRAGAGENWHSFVQYCIDKNWAGLENLSLIPGNVGASPMQNIGAYGVELQEVFWDLEAYDLKQKVLRTFTSADCEFGYRDSVFKRKYKDRFAVINVTFRLRKKPIFHTSYGAIQQELERIGVHQLSIRAISQAVINIRSSKLPDPKEIANAGSFFKNPSVTSEVFDSLHKKFPDIVAYKNADGTIKLAAGWLIEQCGWKGFRRGDAGCHARQALVLVNYGNATGREIYKLSEEILQSVKKKFGVTLEREVNII